MNVWVCQHLIVTQSTASPVEPMRLKHSRNGWLVLAIAALSINSNAAAKIATTKHFACQSSWYYHNKRDMFLINIPTFHCPIQCIASDIHDTLCMVTV
jgi:hypothetical protein